MKKGIIILLVTCMGMLGLKAQQDAQFTLFPWATMYYNAGATGSQNNTLCFTGLFRQQYTGFQDTYPNPQQGGAPLKVNTSPQQILFNIESYTRKLRGGIGLSLIKDKIGFFNNIGVRLGYAYKLNIPTGSIGIGLQVGLISQKLDPAYFNPLQPGDPILDQLGSKPSWLNLDFNFGLFYKAERWYAGVSATQLFEKIRLSGDNSNQLSRNLYFHGGYTWVIPSNPSWSLEPQALIKTDLATAQYDIMVLAKYNGILWTGVSYRVQDAVSVLFGARPFYNSSNNYLKGLEMGVGYSFTTSKLGYKPDRSYGDIEVMLRYCFDIFREEVFSGYGSSRSIYKNQY